MDSGATQIPTSKEQAGAHWLAEYDFWHKIITGEVERLRFNDGYEPLEVDLYPTRKQKGVPAPDYVGKLKIGRQKFRAEGRLGFDANGKEFLRVSILTETKK